jgi:REP element-mobilizing transposase RayT
MTAMPNTYTQLLIHLVFAVQDRQSLIHESMREDLYKYVTGIVQQRGHKLLAVNGMPDHIHLLIGLRPDVALSDLVRDIKAFSAKHVNSEGWVRGAFRWQEGYGAFTLSRSQLSTVIEYIRNQERHHHKRTFREEYVMMLEQFDVEYDQRYLFRWLDDPNDGGTVRP